MKIKTIAAVIVLVIAIPSIVFLHRLYDAFYPPYIALIDINQVTTHTNIAFPKSAVLMEAYSWQGDDLIAKIRFSKADLHQFLSQYNFKDTVTEKPDSRRPFVNDSVTKERGESEIVSNWKVERIHHYVQTDYPGGSDIVGSKMPGLDYGLDGLTSFIIDLDDAKSAIIYLRWDARGGFAR